MFKFLLIESTFRHLVRLVCGDACWSHFKLPVLCTCRIFRSSMNTVRILVKKICKKWKNRVWQKILPSPHHQVWWVDHHRQVWWVDQDYWGGLISSRLTTPITLWLIARMFFFSFYLTFYLCHAAIFTQLETLFYYKLKDWAKSFSGKS